MRRILVRCLAAALTPGPEAYFVLMRDLAEGLVHCLKGGE